jgi:hypothetical protein
MVDLALAVINSFGSGPGTGTLPGNIEPTKEFTSTLREAI